MTSRRESRSVAMTISDGDDDDDQREPGDQDRQAAAASSEKQERCHERGSDDQRQPGSGAKRPFPPVQRSRALALPEAVGLPEPGAAVDRGERGGKRADTLSRHDVDLDARLLHRAEHARVVRPMRTSAAKHKRGATLRRIGLH